jgi:predicted GNAT family acetyltransferase
MELEDLGRDPTVEDAGAHEAAVRERIAAGRLLVLEAGSDLVFQVNIGTSLPDGAQVGGTYVPPMYRGRGYAKLGMAATLRHLLARHPAVTLHVRESNTPAVRCYEAVGFERYAPYRMAVVGG